MVAAGCCAEGGRSARIVVAAPLGLLMVLALVGVVFLTLLPLAGLVALFVEVPTVLAAPWGIGPALAAATTPRPWKTPGLGVAETTGLPAFTFTYCAGFVFAADSCCTCKVVG